MFYTEWVRKGCHWMASVSNAWRYEFRNSAKIGLSEGLLFGISMIPRWFANATRPQPFKAVKISENAGTPVAGDKVKVFVRNGLLFPRFQAEGENRPKYDDELPGGSTRQKKLMEEVDQLDGDVVSVCYLESHCGDEFEGQANTDLGKKGFVEAACDVRKSSKIFGSGIYCATKNPNVKRRFYPFQNVGGGDRIGTEKGFFIEEHCNETGELVARVAYSHFQSGLSTDKHGFFNVRSCSKLRDLQAHEVKDKMEELDKAEGVAKMWFCAGDLNANRLDVFDMYPEFDFDALTDTQISAMMQAVCPELYTSGFDINNFDQDAAKTLMQMLRPDLKSDEFKLQEDNFVESMQVIRVGFDEDAICKDSAGKKSIPRTILREIIRLEGPNGDFHDQIPESIKGQPGLLNPKTTEVKHGFSAPGKGVPGQLTAKEPTQVDIAELNKDKSVKLYKSAEAVDGAFGNCRLIVKKGPSSEYDQYTDASDHLGIIVESEPIAEPEKRRASL